MAGAAAGAGTAQEVELLPEEAIAAAAAVLVVNAAVAESGVGGGGRGGGGGGEGAAGFLDNIAVYPPPPPALQMLMPTPTSTSSAVSSSSPRPAFPENAAEAALLTPAVVSLSADRALAIRDLDLDLLIQNDGEDEDASFTRGATAGGGGGGTTTRSSRGLTHTPSSSVSPDSAAAAASSTSAHASVNQITTSGSHPRHSSSRSSLSPRLSITAPAVVASPSTSSAVAFGDLMSFDSSPPPLHRLPQGFGDHARISDLSALPSSNPSTSSLPQRARPVLSTPSQISLLTSPVTTELGARATEHRLVQEPQEADHQVGTLTGLLMDFMSFVGATSPTSPTRPPASLSPDSADHPAGLPPLPLPIPKARDGVGASPELSSPSQGFGSFFGSSSSYGSAESGSVPEDSSFFDSPGLSSSAGSDQQRKKENRRSITSSIFGSLGRTFSGFSTGVPRNRGIPGSPGETDAVEGTPPPKHSLEAISDRPEDQETSNAARGHHFVRNEARSHSNPAISFTSLFGRNQTVKLPRRDHTIAEIAPKMEIDSRRSSRAERDSLLDLMLVRAPVRLVTEEKVESLVLTQQIADDLRSHLPPLLREASRWKLLYSTDHHGISMNTMYRKCEEEAEGAPVMLVLRDSMNGIFGGFASEAFKVHTGYYGNGSCFLWKKCQDETKVFGATGANDYLILSQTNFIAMGGGEGHFGLWIDGEFYNGHSGPCLTFNNEQLSCKPEFEVVVVEIWGFEL
ncbi:TLD-domain-containing protein [Zopfochytrium polystomum]|nr:TLD-domain-containing protein [Zopfochytrium polystomum]